MTKKFCPCIYLFRGNAVRSITDRSVVETDPLRLVAKYCENGADELLVYDLSEGEGDETHEEALDLIREIVTASEIDVTCGGNIKRLEDVKKILYTGSKKCVLDWEKEGNYALTKEASERFGRDKILASIDSPENLPEDAPDLATAYLCGLVLLNPHIIRETESRFGLPLYVQIGNIALNKLLEIFAYEKVCAVTGNTINDNAGEIGALKELCIQNGISVVSPQVKLSWSDLKAGENGLVPVVVQDYRTLEVLMMAYMNEQAYLDTVKTGKMHYYSRSRQSQWLKGETSGHFQFVKSLTADCDFDTILAKVSQVGVACHTGARSCFFNEILTKETAEEKNPLQVFQEVYDVILDRKANPKEGSYTNYLFDKGIDKILKKCGEEATEMVIAAKNPNPNEVVYEISDLLYHMMVLMAERGIGWEEITTELANR